MKLININSTNRKGVTEKKLAACSRPIGSQIGDITKWTNRRPEAQLADQSGAPKSVTEKNISSTELQIPLVRWTGVIKNYF